MKKTLISILFFLAFLTGVYASDSSREITDMAGRKVSIPSRINKIFSVNPNGAILVYTFDPELLGGWNYKIPEKSRKYIPEKYFNIKNYGQLFGNATNASFEEILKMKPDIIIYMFPFNKNNLSSIERLQSKLQIPFVVVDPELEKIPEAYRFMGYITGNTKRAKVLADFSGEILNKAKKVSSKSIKYPSFYYGLSHRGLSTISEDSVYMDVFRLCGLSQVYKNKTGAETKRADINMEVLIGLNPEYILIGGNKQRGKNSTDWIYKDKFWKMLPAVQKGNVFAVPDVPFNWIDKPPSVNRLSGIMWLLWIFYPSEMSNDDFENEIRKFYKTFYHLKIDIKAVKNNIEIRKVSYETSQ